jgi:hypothetical protein
MLLLLFLMGRTPHLLVPDDIDPYKAGVCSEIIGQCDVEHIMTSLIKTIFFV